MVSKADRGSKNSLNGRSGSGKRKNAVKDEDSFTGTFVSEDDIQKKEVGGHY